MGDIKKVLHCSDLGQREIESRGIWFDFCENCHFHFKNFRFDFSPREWDEFFHTLRIIYDKSVEISRQTGWKEGGDPRNAITIHEKNPYNFSDYYPYRFLIEWQRDNTFHIHYREFRLRLSEKEFDMLVDAFVEAREQKKRFVEPNFKPGKQTVPIDDIQPYDEGHRAGELDVDHSWGIKLAKKLIEDGRKLTPILIRPNGQRLDGFKRYMAQKELGYKTIEVIVDPDGLMGDQKGQPLEQQENDNSILSEHNRVRGC